MVLAYLNLAFKVLLRRKFFTFISLFGTAFTLLVLITAVAFYENSYSPQRPESRADRFLLVYRMEWRNEENNWTWNGRPGYKFLDKYIRSLPGIEKMTIHTASEQVITFRDGRKFEMMLKRTDGSFWEVMDFRFLEGSPFSQEDESNRNFVAVINQATRDLYFGREGVVGEIIEADGQRFRIAGVVANVPEYRTSPYADIWVPQSTEKTDNYRESMMGEHQATLLVKSRADIPKVKQALAAMLPDIQSPDPQKYGIGKTVADTYPEVLARKWNGDWSNWDPEPGLGRFVAMAAGLVLLFMLLPAVNLININVSRIMERTGEIGVRKAFGATSGSLTTQFLIENLVLTLLGGLLGLGGSWLVLRAINTSGLIPHAQLTLNFSVFLAALVLSLLFGLFSGVYPAWRMSRLHPANALKGGLR